MFNIETAVYYEYSTSYSYLYLYHRVIWPYTVTVLCVSYEDRLR